MEGGRVVYYDLDEENKWATSREELDRAINASKEEGTVTKVCDRTPSDYTVLCVRNT